MNISKHKFRLYITRPSKKISESNATTVYDAYRKAISNYCSALRCQKRKRCLALADYAEAESFYHTTLANGFWLLRNDMTKRDEERRISKRWDKWQNRWLALADKFTEKEIKQ